MSLTQPGGRSGVVSCAGSDRHWQATDTQRTAARVATCGAAVCLGTGATRVGGAARQLPAWCIGASPPHCLGLY